MFWRVFQSLLVSRNRHEQKRLALSNITQYPVSEKVQNIERLRRKTKGFENQKAVV